MSFKPIMMQRLAAQEPQSHRFKHAPVFHRNLEARLDERRKANRMHVMNVPRKTVDFSSNDFLSLATSGLLKTEFLNELERNPDFQVGQSGSRLMDGNTEYLENLEKEMADFFRADTCLIFNSGYDANSAIFSVLPQLGDAILYDELVHASILDGLDRSRATIRKPFIHNDLNSLREMLLSLWKSEPHLAQGKGSVIIAIESVYSMDGDVSPVGEILKIAQEVFPLGNTEIFLDEAHSTGLMGPLGRGMACELGIEKKIACRLHTFGKAMGCNGAIVLGSESIRNMLLNFATGLIFTAGPAFPFAACMRAAVNVLKDGKAEPMRAKLQSNVRYFFRRLFSHPVWKQARQANLLEIPVAENYENRTLLTQIVPLWTQARDNHHLASHLHLSDYKAFPVSYPVVPKGQGRIRLVFHAANTAKEIDTLIQILCDWAQEMIDSRTKQVPLSCTWAKIIQAGEVRKQKRLEEEAKQGSRDRKVSNLKNVLGPLIVESKTHQYVEKSLL
ncbi:hypothetical protein ASPWEDRAFT_120806 [Aspergillus wentii DTO 134E9]|uniref:Aminotransferase class I/classII large domain-containing protein n=1 Tax=Aspergillus wentii DTO 134E9 TaxID=1073089 RepID=A0A1L9R592_ASPWE|nr:uncharacterized protein ASPWEDRAFT_120806 [Aspergillus wentii DTO 134E9]OJJ30105.1 hypothetical protein ASPWEDRAFT_120806 [Aspergillus wentii DTO 134E9]